MLESGFAEIRLRERAPDLNFGDVRYVLGYRDLAVHLVAFDRQFLEQVNVSLRVHHLPMRVRCIRRLEVVRESQHAVAVLRRVGHVSGVGFCALEGSTLVAVLGHAAGSSDYQCG